MTPPQLPTSIKTRLAEARKHALALSALLEQASAEEFAAAVAEGSIDSLVDTVYPLERAFEILVNFVAELSRLGLEHAGLVPDASAVKVFAQLEAQGIISKSRRDRLVAIYRARNEMQHAYPDVAAASTYEAAEALLPELGGFFSDYASWMRRLASAT